MAFASIDDYISSCPEDVRPIVERVRRVIHQAVPGCDETISYGMPTVTREDRSLLHFAAWKHHISVYPIPAGDEALDRELAAYRAGKGTLRFPLQQPMPYDLIERVAVRLARQQGTRRTVTER